MSMIGFACETMSFKESTLTCVASAERFAFKLFKELMNFSWGVVPGSVTGGGQMIGPGIDDAGSLTETLVGTWRARSGLSASGGAATSSSVPRDFIVLSMPSIICLTMSKIYGWSNLLQEEGANSRPFASRHDPTRPHRLELA